MTSGGGVKPNMDLLLDAKAAVWMANEAQAKGLKMCPPDGGWDPTRFQGGKPNESLKGFWWLLEWVPGLSRVEDFPKPGRSILPHCGAPRYIQPGQKIHLSVAFQRDYSPRARLPPGHSWDNIIGHAFGDMEWMTQSKDILELDHYDFSAAKDMVKRLKSTERQIVQQALRSISIFLLYSTLSPSMIPLLLTLCDSVSSSCSC